MHAFRRTRLTLSRNSTFRLLLRDATLDQVVTYDSLNALLFRALKSCLDLQTIAVDMYIFINHRHCLLFSISITDRLMYLFMEYF